MQRRLGGDVDRPHDTSLLDTSRRRQHREPVPRGGDVGAVGVNAQAWKFVVLTSPEQRAVVATAAANALEVIEPVYGMTRPAADDDSRSARNNRATYELHDRAAEFASVLFTQKRFPTASELLLGGSIFPAMQNFLLAARAQGLGACLTSWALTTAT
jgi:nitroreductase